MKKIIYIVLLFALVLNVNAQIKPFQIGTTGIVPPNQINAQGVTTGVGLTPSAINNVEGDSGNTTSRLVVSSYQQSNQSGAYGDGIRLIAEHGSAKNGLKFYARGLSPEVITTNSEPFNVTTGQTLKIKINGGSEKTITFNTTYGSFTSGAATADQISDLICKQLNYSNYPSGKISALYYGQAIVYLTQNGTTVNENNLKVAIYSCKYGTTASVEITGGTALTGLGLSIGVTYGLKGTVSFDDSTYARQVAWVIAHDYPNDPSSNNKHKHLSFEVPDSTGAMQTRLSITSGKNVSEVQISSAIFICNGYPVTISNSANSFKDLDFSRDNTGRKISRVGQIRCDSDANGGNMLHKVYDDAGTSTTLLTLDRLNKNVLLNTSIQGKIKATTNTAQSVMTLTGGGNGNTFVLSGTGTVNYIANTNWQAGSEITVILQGAATLTHNAGSPTSTNIALKLIRSQNFTAGASGSIHTFKYDGSAYSNTWIEQARSEFDITALPESRGGTGQLTYTTGDLLYASGSTTLSKLNDVATGNALISGGTSTAPAWGKIGLTTHVSGTLPVANGGTGLTTVGGTNTLLYTTTADNVSSIATANNGVLITSSGGVPSVSSTLPSAVQANITSTGTVTSGVWNGTNIAATAGGTGTGTYTLGQILYSSATNTLSKLSGNTTTTTQFLAQTGNGTVSAAPVWTTINLSGSGTLDFPSTVAGTVSELTITVTGAADGDPCDVGVPAASMPGTGSFECYISSTNTATVRYVNNSLTLTQDPASGTFKVKVLK